MTDTYALAPATFGGVSSARTPIVVASLAATALLSVLASSTGSTDMKTVQNVSLAFEQSNRPAPLPAIEYDGVSPDAMALNVRKALGEYIGAVQKVAAIWGDLPIERLVVSHSAFSEEGFSQLTVTHWLNASSEFAMRYWDEVDNFSSFSANCLTTNVRWTMDD